MIRQTSLGKALVHLLGQTQFIYTLADTTLDFSTTKFESGSENVDDVSVIMCGNTCDNVRVQGSGFQMQGSGFRISNFGFKV